MPLFFLVLTLSVIFVEPALDTARQLNNEVRASQAQSLGSTLMVVRNALAAYMQVYPSFAGEVPLTALGLPAWLRPDLEVHAMIEGGRGFVYYTPPGPLADLTSMLGQRPSGRIGIAKGSRLVSAISSVDMALPASIPDRSVVLVI